MACTPLVLPLLPRSSVGLVGLAEIEGVWASSYRTIMGDNCIRESLEQARARGRLSSCPPLTPCDPLPVHVVPGICCMRCMPR